MVRAVRVDVNVAAEALRVYSSFLYLVTDILTSRLMKSQMPGKMFLFLPLACLARPLLACARPLPVVVVVGVSGTQLPAGVYRSVPAKVLCSCLALLVGPADTA